MRLPLPLTKAAALSLCTIIAALPVTNLAVAQTTKESKDTFIVRRANPDKPGQHEEFQVKSDGELMMLAGERVFTSSQVEFLAENQGSGPIEQPTQPREKAEGIIIELNEPALAEVYADIVRFKKTPSLGISNLSVDETEILNEHRTLAVEQQDFVLNRLSSLSANNGISAQGLAPDQTQRFHTAVNALVLHNASLQEVQNAVKNDPELSDKIKRVVPNQAVYASLDTSVPLIDAPAVWERLSSKGVALDGTGVRIGIVDTGVDYTHPDLGGCFGPGCKVAGGYDLVNGDSNPMDDHGHGTHCAATAAGNGGYVDSAGNVTPVRGVAPGATLYAYKVLNDYGTGSGANVIGGLERCADPNRDGDLSDHLDVCSLSLGGSGDPDDLISQAADATSRAGVVVVTAAGNAGPAEGTIGSPGTSRLAITVAATCKPNDTSSYCSNGAVASFSSRGPIPDFPDVQKPDIAAPGVRICAARFASYQTGKECLGGTRIAISGTSMATPHVAGVAALLKQAHPEASPEQVKSAIKVSATDLGLSPNTQGAGLVNAFDALTSLGIPSSIAKLSEGAIRFDITPTSSVVTASREVRVTSLADTPLEFVPSFTTQRAGISADITPERATINPGETVSFNLQLEVKVTEIPSNSPWNGRLRFTTTAGLVETGIYGVIRDRLVADIKSFDLGVKNGFDLSWKESLKLRLTNQLSDASTSYQVSTSCCGVNNKLTSNGIRTSVGASWIEIPPGGTVELPITVEATGFNSGNDRYMGTITLASSQQTLTIPVTFFKGWELGITHENGTSRHLDTIIHTKRSALSLLSAPDGVRKSILLDRPGPWQIDSVFEPRSIDSARDFVFKQNIALLQTSTDITIRASEARQKIEMKFLGPQGEPIKNGLWYVAPYNSLGEANFGVFNKSRGFTFRINEFAPNIVIASSAYDVNDSTIRAWQGLLVGDSSSNDMEIGGEPFVTKSVSLPSSGSANDPTNLEAFAFAHRSVGIKLGGTDAIVPYGKTATLHVSANRSITPDSPDFRFFPSTRLGTIPSKGPTFGSHVKVSSAGAFAGLLSPNLPNLPIDDFYHQIGVPAGYDDNIALGAGPEANIGTWNNPPDAIPIFQPAFGPQNMYLSAGGSYTSNHYAADRQIQFTLLRNGALFNSGSISSDFKMLPGLNAPNMPPGDYYLKLERQLTINGVRTKSTAENSFRLFSFADQLLKPVDQNPPSLKHLMLVSNELVQNTIDPLLTNTLYFDLDPRAGLLKRAERNAPYYYETMPDELRSVSLEQSADGIAWSSVSIDTISEGQYRADLPILESTQLYSYRISALDLEGNTFKYTFQIPVGQALVVPTPTPEPTATSSPPENTGDLTRPLPSPKARLRSNRLQILLPPLTAINLDYERSLAKNWLQARNISDDQKKKITDIPNWKAKCLINLSSQRKVRTIKVSGLRYKKQRVIEAGKAPPSKSRIRFNYSCNFSLGVPQKVYFGTTRRSPQIWFSRSASR